MIGKNTEIEGLRTVIARNDEEIHTLNTELDEERQSRARMTELANTRVITHFHLHDRV
jgi:hypothetical protein